MSTNAIDSLLQFFQASGHTFQELGLNEGATSEEIYAIEKTTGYALPESFKLWLSKVNGQDHGTLRFLPDHVTMISCAEIIQQWKAERDYDADTAEFYDEYQDKDRIRQTILHPSRIPIANQDGAWSIYIDNDPGPEGTVGQLIYIVNECDYIVLAESFDAFLNKYTGAINKGLLKFRASDPTYGGKYEVRDEGMHMDGEQLATVLNRVTA